MHILIVGGLGLIGSHLTERLVKEGHQVTILDDYSNGRESNIESVRDEVRIIKHNIANVYSVIKASFADKYDIIYALHCHPRSFSIDDPTKDYGINSNGMLNIIHLARRTNAKIIYTSNSGLVDTSILPITDNSRPLPTTPYDAHKLLSEHYLQIYAEDYVIFRLSAVYGPRQRVNEELKWYPLVASMCKNIVNNKPVRVDGLGTQTRDLVYVDDVVDALLLAMNSDYKKPMILATGVETSVLDVVDTLADITEQPIECISGTRADGDIDRMQYNCTSALTNLGWKAKTSLNKGLSLCLDWWKKNDK